MNKMKYGAVGALVGIVFGVVLYFVLPRLLLTGAEINSQYYQSQYGNLSYPSGATGSIFGQPTIILLLGVLGFGVGYMVGKMKR